MGFKIHNRLAFAVLCVQIIGPIIVIGLAFWFRP